MYFKALKIKDKSLQIIGFNYIFINELIDLALNSMKVNYFIISLLSAFCIYNFVIIYALQKEIRRNVRQCIQIKTRFR